MTVCPIAIVAGCRKCPAFSMCPLKGVLGDHVKAENGARPTSSPQKGAVKRPRKSN